MKKHILSLIVIVTNLFSFGQTAANFTVNDCGGNSHDLFGELNSGKVVVICWVMPCISCASKALVAYNVCQSYSVSNPGQVKFYIADDVANTSCANLKLWADTSVAVGCTLFSNSAVSMSSYGVAGMPKTVVLSGAITHSVYFNQNGGAAGNQAALQGSVNQALADIIAGIKENSINAFELKAFPNPVSKSLNVTYNLTNTNDVKFEVLSFTGQKIKEIKFNTSLLVGKNETKLNVEGFESGIYYLKITSLNLSQTVKFTVIN